MATRRHKMSLDVEYVKDWDVQDALREVFQNSIDHNDWFWNYHNKELQIVSNNATLSTRTLLLGHSKKNGDAIGKFGEGYKLAMLVLCRLGYSPIIRTGKEVWKPKLINSRTYQTQQLVFDVSDGYDQYENIQFIIPNIDNQVFSDLMDRNLHVRKPTIGWQTRYGQILTEDYAGKVFVGGLYVCNIDMRHGYDLNPSCINLDRDRRLVRDFDLQWLTCQMWKETEEYDYLLTLIKEDAPDVKYLDSFTYSAKQGLADKAAEAFLDEHGPEAVPVVDNYDISQAKEQGHENIVLVPKVTVQLLGQSSLWSRPEPKIVKKTPREILLDFQKKFPFSREAEEEFEVILTLAEGWRS